jgi:hypothetical protein
MYQGSPQNTRGNVDTNDDAEGGVFKAISNGVLGLKQHTKALNDNDQDSIRFVLPQLAQAFEKLISEQPNSTPVNNFALARQAKMKRVAKELLRLLRFMHSANLPLSKVNIDNFSYKE